jgi:hypothetical protein
MINNLTRRVVLTFVIGAQISDLRGQKAGIKTPEDLVAYQAAVQSTFTYITLAFIVVGTAAFWFTAWACRERVIRTQPRVTVKRDDRHPEDRQAPGVPVRIELLLPDRPGAGLGGPDRDDHLHQVPAQRREVQADPDETEARKLADIEAHHEKPEDFITPTHAV